MQPARYLFLCLALLSGCLGPHDLAEGDGDSDEAMLDETSQELVGQGWVTSGSLADANPAQYGRFGRTVSVAADRIAVTRQTVTAGNLGSTQVFARSAGGWYRQFTHTTALDRFPVATLGSKWLFVGEPCAQITTSCRGRIRGWSWWNNSYWAEWIMVNDAALPRDFGRALTFDGTNLYVAGGSSVYHYVVSDPYYINLVRRYDAPASAYTNPAFGYSVATADGYLAVSAPTGYRYSGGANVGSPGYVHIYRNGALLQTLTGVGTEIGGGTQTAFGATVSMSGTRLAVAAPIEAGRARTVYVYGRGTTGVYSLQSTLVQPASPGYSTSAAIAGSSLAVTTSAPAGAGAGVLRLYQIERFGTSLAAEFALGTDWAPVAIQGSRVAAAQPLSSSNRGSVLTFYNQPLVLEQLAP